MRLLSKRHPLQLIVPGGGASAVAGNGGVVAEDPDPTTELTTIRGVTRTLDDWTTTFHLALTVLPGRPEAAAYVRVGRRIADVLGGSDCRAAFLVVGNQRAARRGLGSAADEYLCFVDPEGTAT